MTTNNNRNLNSCAEINGFTISYCELHYLKQPITLNIIQKDLNICLKKIKNGKWENEINVLREILSNENEVAYNKQKKKLPVMVFSGIFEGRFLNEGDYIKRYTQWIILDIDKKENEFIKSLADIQELKTKLSSEKFIYAIFISPSQNGLKILVKGNQTLEQHKTFFNQLVDFFKLKYSVTIDPSGSNINRFCYVSHDPNIYINPQSSIYEIDLNDTIPSNGKTIPSGKRIQYRGDNEGILDDILRYLKETNQSITNDYKNWINVGFALITEFHKNKQKARDYFHEFSKLDEGKYSREVCNEKFNQLAENSKQRVSIASIIYLAKQKEFKIDNSISAKYLPLATNHLRLLNYSNRFLKTYEEILLFEFFCTKARAFHCKEFYYSTERIKQETRILRTKQEKAINFFLEIGILEIEIKGYPKTKYFKVNIEKVYELLPEIYSNAS